MHLGIAGEFRVVVTQADGTTKIDTGFQKNLILNQGLDFFGGSFGININKHCIVGSGNSAPTVTQVSLDSPLKIAGSIAASKELSYTDNGDDLYITSELKQYRFTGLDNANISEVGLVSAKRSGSDSPTISDYYLTTRALIKDSAGNAASITVKTGETLDIFYKIYKVIDISDKNFTINMDDGAGNLTPYNATVRPFAVGSAEGSVSIYLTELTKVTAQTSDFLPITTDNQRPEITVPSSMSAYVAGSFKRVATINFSLTQANMDIRVITSHYSIWNPLIPFQIRFGSVADDSPIVKTNKDTLSIPLEFSWGRYEGEL